MDGIKVLAQVKPSAGVLTDAYVCPSGASTVISTISVCNQANTFAHFWLARAIGGTPDTPRQYDYFNVFVFPFATFIMERGLTMAGKDVLRVKSDNGNLSFTVSGTEIT